MKVKFNLPTRRYNQKISFDNNTTFGFGNVQPLFCKFVLPKSKFSCNINQLTRLSPLVVPTFARLKQCNDFVYVNINKVFPAFDAFLSHTPVNGTQQLYTPQSLPSTTNQYLFVCLLKFAYANSYRKDNGSISNISNNIRVTDYLHGSHIVVSGAPVLDVDTLTKLSSACDFSIQVSDTVTSNPNHFVGRYNQTGRFWFAVLKGLGYSLDYFDTKPVSVLPIWAFVKAYYDIYYPKRYNNWHSSNYYEAINNYYNGDFYQDYDYNGHHFDMINSDPLVNLFGGTPYSFFAFNTLDNDVFQAALASPLNASSPSMGNNRNDSIDIDSSEHVPAISDSDVPANISADSLSLVNRLWSFVSRSSVVGQSVKDWFKVHFGISPSEDMFDSSVCFAQKPNFISINSVVSTADTANANGARLGDLAGQAFSNVSDSVSFDVPNFGFIFCLSSIVPLTRVSGGTQPELYNTSYYDMPFPDFDGLGYEVLNNSSFMQPSAYFNSENTAVGYVNKGYGYVPRFTSYKTYNNVRSGGFSLPSIQDSYLSYCEDTIVQPETGNIPSTFNLQAFFPWRYVGLGSPFLSFDRIFYNQKTDDPFFPSLHFIDDNFMCQTAFDFDISSYLKPLSDSYSIESLGKQLVSVKRQ